MCDICRKKVGSLALPHEEEKCPFISSQYCGYCSQYGHSSYKCIHFVKETGEIEEPIQQVKYNKPILDVVDTPQSIRSVLSSYGVKLSGIPKENLRRLKHIAECGKCLHSTNEEDIGNIRDHCLYAGKAPCETERGKVLVLHSVAKKKTK